MVLNVMFDYLKCEYPLPLTDEIKEQLPDENWAEINFQTKSLDCYLEIHARVLECILILFLQS